VNSNKQSASKPRGVPAFRPPVGRSGKGGSGGGVGTTVGDDARELEDGDPGEDDTSPLLAKVRLGLESICAFVRGVALW